MAQSNTAQHLQQLMQAYTSNTTATESVLAGTASASDNLSQIIAYRVAQQTTTGLNWERAEPKPDPRLISPLQPEQIEIINHGPDR